MAFYTNYTFLFSVSFYLKKKQQVISGYLLTTSQNATCIQHRTLTIRERLTVYITVNIYNRTRTPTIRGTRRENLRSSYKNSLVYHV